MGRTVDGEDDRPHEPDVKLVCYGWPTYFLPATHITFTSVKLWLLPTVHRHTWHIPVRHHPAGLYRHRVPSEVNVVTTSAIKSAADQSPSSLTRKVRRAPLYLHILTDVSCCANCSQQHIAKQSSNLLATLAKRLNEQRTQKLKLSELTLSKLMNIVIWQGQHFYTTHYIRVRWLQSTNQAIADTAKWLVKYIYNKRRGYSM